jgi:hypothetical protein
MKCKNFYAVDLRGSEMKQSFWWRWNAVNVKARIDPFWVKLKKPVSIHRLHCLESATYLWLK